MISEVQISPKLCASYWVLFIIATDAAFGITCIYWSLIFDGKCADIQLLIIFQICNLRCKLPCNLTINYIRKVVVLLAIEGSLYCKK